METELNTAQIEKLIKLNVGLVYLFGSYPEGKAGPLSDIDIAILFKGRSALNDREIGETYNQLYDLFTDIFRGKSIDIVFLQKANLELQFDVIQYGKMIYESVRGEKNDFEERTTLRYADFKPILKEFNETIIQRGEPTQMTLKEFLKSEAILPRLDGIEKNLNRRNEKIAHPDSKVSGPLQQTHLAPNPVSLHLQASFQIMPPAFPITDDGW